MKKLLLCLSLLLIPVSAGLAAEPLAAFIAPDAEIGSVEERRLLEALRQRENELDLRGEKLDHRALELQSLSGEVGTRIEELKRRQQQLADLLVEKSRREQERLARLSRVYERMDPLRAADLLTRLDERLAMAIFAGMQARAAGNLLNHLPIDLATRFTRNFADLEQ